MKKILFIILLIISTNRLLAQLVNPYSFQLYQFNYSIYNPAFTAFDENQKLDFMGKVVNSKLDLGYNGALISYENALSDNNWGIGFLTYSEQLSYRSSNSIGLSLRKTFVIEQGKSISLGSRINYQHTVVDLSLHKPTNIYDYFWIDAEPFKKDFFNLETGISFKLNNFYGGVAVYDLYNSFNEPDLYIPGRLLLLTGGLRSVISENFISDNSLNVKTDFQYYAVDFNNNFLLANRVIAGISFSSFNGFEANGFYSSVSGGIRMKNVEIISLIYSPRYLPIRNGRYGLSAEFLVRARM